MRCGRTRCGRTHFSRRELRQKFLPKLCCRSRGRNAISLLQLPAGRNALRADASSAAESCGREVARSSREEEISSSNGERSGAGSREGERSSRDCRREQQLRAGEPAIFCCCRILPQKSRQSIAAEENIASSPAGEEPAIFCCWRAGNILQSAAWQQRLLQRAAAETAAGSCSCVCGCRDGSSSS